MAGTCKYLLFVLFAVIITTVFTQKCMAQRWCDICAMDLQKYRRTKYILTLDDGSKKYTCSIHCTAIIMKKQNVKYIEASDYLSCKMIDARNAYYVVGSSVKGVMSGVGKLAFETEKEALDFQKGHGGKLTGFDGALNAASRHLSEDMRMIKGNIEKSTKLGGVIAESNSCFICHGIEGHGGIRNPGSKKGYITAWDTDQFVRDVKSKAGIKEIILNGKADNMEAGILKMPAWRGLIKGKELHALANYIWSLHINK